MSAQDDVRRLRVASLHLRGLMPIEIEAALRKSGIAADLETVCTDIAFLQQVWATEVQLDQQTQRAQLLAEIREARRAAWATGELALVLKAVEQEAKLLDDPTPTSASPMLKLR